MKKREKLYDEGKISPSSTRSLQSQVLSLKPIRKESKSAKNNAVEDRNGNTSSKREHYHKLSTVDKDNEIKSNVMNFERDYEEEEMGSEEEEEEDMDIISIATGST